MNYDGSRGENFGKLKIKYNAKVTNKEKDALSFDTSWRISKEDSVDHIYSIYYQNNGRWISKYCNQTDIVMNANKSQHNVSPVVKYKTKASRPRFSLNVKIEWFDVQDIPKVVQLYVD